jgi:hypothetical protein
MKTSIGEFAQATRRSQQIHSRKLPEDNSKERKKAVA